MADYGQTQLVHDAEPCHSTARLPPPVSGNRVGRHPQAEPGWLAMSPDP